jgi:hypothetical protein
MEENVGIKRGEDENAELRPVRTVTGCPNAPGIRDLDVAE